MLSPPSYRHLCGVNPCSVDVVERRLGGVLDGLRFWKCEYHPCCPYSCRELPGHVSESADNGPVPYDAFRVPEVAGMDRVPFLAVDDEVAARVYYQAFGIRVEVLLTSYAAYSLPVGIVFMSRCRNMPASNICRWVSSGKLSRPRAATCTGGRSAPPSFLWNSE